jgi:hypothetical protein
VLSFACDHCGSLVFFENTRCLHCGTELGFVAEQLTLVGLEGENSQLSRCANAEMANCNWLVNAAGSLCLCCELTQTRPSDSDPVGLAEFADSEAAKRRVVFQLLDLGLPQVDPEHLRFDMLSSEYEAVITGHDDGLITVDLAESDDARREQRRLQLGEPYRTLVGHLRHELGHYFQPRLLSDDGDWSACRTLFGDEREDYQDALSRHYRDGPPHGWEADHVSAYATMHPWEDWAETFAHYLHIRDTLETAAEYGVVVKGPRAVTHDRSLMATPQPEAGERSFAELIDNWLPLTYALNAVNRSMGRDDLYPFTLAPAVIDKLRFVHDRIQAVGQSPSADAATGRD